MASEVGCEAAAAAVTIARVACGLQAGATFADLQGSPVSWIGVITYSAFAAGTYIALKEA